MPSRSRPRHHTVLPPLLLLILTFLCLGSGCVAALARTATPAAGEGRPKTLASTVEGPAYVQRPAAPIVQRPLARLSASPLAPGQTSAAGPRRARAATSILFANGFEGSMAMWSVDGYPTWAGTNYRAASGAWSGYCAGDGIWPPGPYADNMEAWLFAGPFNLSGYSSGALTFDVWFDTEISHDWVRALVSVDGVDYYGWHGSGYSAGWVSRAVDLTNVPTLGNVCGRSPVWVAFVFTSDASIVSEGAYIDNVVVSGEAAPVGQPDDDVPGVSIPASPIAGSLAAGSDDDDVYRVQLTSGQRLQASISGPYGTDFRLYLYPPGTSTVKTEATTFVAGATDGTYPRSLNYVATQGGTYYLDAFAQTGAGSYSVTWSVTSAPPPDSTPPVTSVSSSASGWSNRHVTLTFSASDAGSGVDYTTWRIDSGAQQRGPSVTIPALQGGANDGVHTVTYYSVDRAGNAESAKTVQVGIDTVGPTCAARNATVKRGKVCTLVFTSDDALSDQTTIDLVITTGGGKVVKRFSWGYDVAGQWWSTKFRCTLPRGTYRILVSGQDLAGNDASVVGDGRLKVR